MSQRSLWGHRCRCGEEAGVGTRGVGAQACGSRPSPSPAHLSGSPVAGHMGNTSLGGEQHVQGLQWLQSHLLLWVSFKTGSFLGNLVNEQEKHISRNKYWFQNQENSPLWLCFPFLTGSSQMKKFFHSHGRRSTKPLEMSSRWQAPEFLWGIYPTFWHVYLTKWWKNMIIPVYHCNQHGAFRVGGQPVRLGVPAVCTWNLACPAAGQ